MIEVIIVTALGSVIGKKIKNLLLLVILCISVGFLTALLTSVIVQLIGYTTPYRALNFIFSRGLTIYPIFALISALLTKLILKLRQNKLNTKQSPHTIRKNKNPQVINTLTPKEFKKEETIISLSDNNEYFWAKADNEVNSEPKHDLWIKCLYACNHDELKTKVLYVQERVKQLDEEQIVLKNEILKEEREILRNQKKNSKKRLLMLIIYGKLIILSLFSIGMISTDVEYDFPNPLYGKQRLKDLKKVLNDLNLEFDKTGNQEVKISRPYSFQNHGYYLFSYPQSVQEWRKMLNEEIIRGERYLLISILSLAFLILFLSLIIFAFWRLLKRS